MIREAAASTEAEPSRPESYKEEGSTSDQRRNNHHNPAQQVIGQSCWKCEIVVSRKYLVSFNTELSQFLCHRFLNVIVPD